MSDEPRRLSEDPAFADTFRAARGDLPEPERLARIEGLLVAKVAAAAAAGAAGTASAAGAGAASGGVSAGATAVKTGLLVKVFVGLGLLAAVSGGTAAVVLSQGNHADPVGLVPSTPSSAGTALPSAPEPALSLVAPSVTPSATATVAPSVAAPAPSAAAPKVPEMELMNAAQRALAANPGEALAKCSEHARSYPRGMMAEERERIAIEALVGLGRREEAQRRADAFHRTFPQSGYGRRIDAILGH